MKSIETKMGMQNIFGGFILDVDIDQKKENVLLTALSLSGPDNIQKSWNCYNNFQVNMKRLSEPLHLFLLKDAGFLALSKAYAAMCFHWKDFQKLSQPS